MSRSLHANEGHAYRARSDEELLSRFCSATDTDAFEELVRRYKRSIYTYLVRYLRSATLAEDVSQATFVRVYEKADTFTPGRRVRPWLYSIATHQAIDALRKKRRHPTVSLDQEHALNDADVLKLLQTIRSPEPSPVERVEAHERAEWVHRAVNELPHDLRALILLIYFQGLQYREVADAFAMPIGTVKSRVHKALIRLRIAWRRDHTAERD